MEVINTQSWSEKIENKLKKNIFFQTDKNEYQNQTESLPQQFIISYKSTPYIKEEKFHTQSVDWFFMSFLFLFAVLAIVKLQSLRIFSLSLRSIISAKFASALSREGDFLKTRAFIFIILFSCLGIGIILYAFLGDYFQVSMEWLKIIYAILLFSFLFFIKFLVVYLTGILFNMKSLVLKYIQQVVLTDYYIAIFIFPLAFIYNYFPQIELFYVSAALLVLILLYRIIKGFFIFNTKFYMYEIFLYFCTIEILPLLLIVKYSIDQT